MSQLFSGRFIEGQRCNGETCSPFPPPPPPTKDNLDPFIIHLISERYFDELFYMHLTIETNIASINKIMWSYNSMVEVRSRVPHYSTTYFEIST